MSRLLALCLLGGALLAPSAGAQPLPVPAGRAIVLDGTLADGEWADASRVPLHDGGDVYLHADDQYLYVGVRGQAGGWSHVYLAATDTVRVLHASAALGTGLYRAEPPAWTPVQTFTWAMRETGLDEATRAARAAFLRTHGWVANTNQMGTPGEIEFQIDRRLLDPAQPRLAVVYATDAKAPHFWPPALRDDTLKEELIFGTTPPGLDFRPASWMQLAFPAR